MFPFTTNPIEQADAVTKNRYPYRQDRKDMNAYNMIWALWLLSEIILNITFRHRNAEGNSSDRHSLRKIWMTIILAITAGVIISSNISVPVASSPWAGYTGLLLIIAGIVIRMLAVIRLGRFFTVNLAFMDNHRLITSGMYRYIRHPAYAGSLLSFFGFGLSLNNWISLPVIFIPVLIAFINRITVEETMLADRLGEEYKAYQKSTKMIIPFVY